MWFFWKIKTSFWLIVETIKSIKKFPILLLPIFITWVVFALITIYLQYYAVFPDNDILFYLTFFWIFWFITFVLTYTSSIMVNIVRQIETDWIIKIKDAFKESNKKIFKLWGLSLIWAVIWFLLVILEAILAKAKDNKSSWSVNYEWVAKTLWWEWSIFSWFGLWLQVIKDLLRLSVFLSVPNIMWKNKWVISSIKEWWKIIWKHPVEFLWMYGSMFLIWILMALPLWIIFSLSDNWHQFSNLFWILVIIYEWIIWTFSIYMEQMASTLLVLWHMKWEKENLWVEKWQEKPISEIEKPSLLDDVREFSNNSSSQ